MLAVCVTFDIKPERLADFMPLMQDNAAASLNDEPGCHQFDVCVDHGKTQVFLYELYTDAAAFQAHLQMPHFLSFDQACAEMIAQKTVHTYDTVYQPAVKSPA